MPKSGQSVVDIQDLGFAYGDAEVLHGLTMAIGPREVFAIVGPNAAGKTTLLRCVERLLTPKTGTILIDGRDLKTLSARDVSRRAASVPQSHTPAFPYTVQDIVLMGRNPHLGTASQPGPHDVAVAQEAMDELGIRAIALRPYTQLSGGQLQLVLLARALAQEAQVLLLDEPTAHLDFRNRHVVLSTIRDLAVRLGLTVIMTVHDPNDAMQYADRVGLVSDGILIALGTPDEVLTAENLGRLYGMLIEVLTDGNRRVIVAGTPS
ncbi:MAG: ABC transporter ATP-binding protein [Caldiserica bacterium]|nr:ABC transporter ATP-binding protein [Caldisericota bacterium]